MVSVAEKNSSKGQGTELLQLLGRSASHHSNSTTALGSPDSFLPSFLGLFDMGTARCGGSIPLYETDVVFRTELKQILAGIPFGFVLGRPKERDFK